LQTGPPPTLSALAGWPPSIAATILPGFARTILGSKLLERLPERWFLVAIRSILTIVEIDPLRRAVGS